MYPAGTANLAPPSVGETVNLCQGSRATPAARAGMTKSVTRLLVNGGAKNAAGETKTEDPVFISKISEAVVDIALRPMRLRLRRPPVKAAGRRCAGAAFVTRTSLYAAK
jgi:hypothetical protein